MATFAKSTFSAVSYAAARPTYPLSLYQRVLDYHRGPKSLCVDLGCGHGLISQVLSGHFQHVIATDPSPVMISKAQDSSTATQHSNIEYRVAHAESLPFVSDGSVDLVVAGQAAHWFAYPQAWTELHRILREDGTLAFWGYKDPVFVGWPRASAILDRYSYDAHPHRALGSYWEPGRFIVRNLLRDIQPPAEQFTAQQRITYEPDAKTARAGAGELDVAVVKRMTVAQSIDYVRTFSSFHNWQEAHPDAKARKQGGDGDLADEMYDEIKDAEGWSDEGMELDVEWGSVLILARKSQVGHGHHMKVATLT